jgi:ribose transport system substrate-binding protein
MASTKLMYYLPDSANPFWREVVAGIQAKAGAAGMMVETVSAGHDEKTQVTQLEQCLAHHPQAVFISPVEMSSVSDLCRSIRNSGIPVVSVDQTLTGCVTANVISGNMKGGYMAAQHLAACLGAGKAVVHIQAERLPNVVLRTTSFVREIQRKGIRIVKAIQADSSRAVAADAMRAFLAEKVSFDGIFAENDAMALGAIDALKDAHYSPWPVIVGFDGVPEALQAIRDGRMQGTVAQNPRLLGEKAVEVLVSIIGNKRFEATTTVLPTLITPQDSTGGN